MSDNTRHLTPDQLAARLGVSLRTIERWRVTGEGPVYLRAGRRCVYPVASVETWEAARLHPSYAAERAGVSQGRAA